MFPNLLKMSESRVMQHAGNFIIDGSWYKGGLDWCANVLFASSSMCFSRQWEGQQPCWLQDGSVSTSHEKLNTYDFGKCLILEKALVFLLFRRDCAEVAKMSTLSSQAKQLPFPCQATPTPQRVGKPPSECQGGCFDAVSEFFFSHHDSLCFADTCPMTGTFLSHTASTQLRLTQ